MASATGSKHLLILCPEGTQELFRDTESLQDTDEKEVLYLGLKAQAIILSHFVANLDQNLHTKFKVPESRKKMSELPVDT